MMIALRSPRVVALSIDGNEAAAGRTGPALRRYLPACGGGRFPPHRPCRGVERTRRHPRRHSLLGAERIDHGVRAAEDAALMDEIRDRRHSARHHARQAMCAWVFIPATRTIRSSGCGSTASQLSVGTDDPELLETTLVDEYAQHGRDLRLERRWSAGRGADLDRGVLRHARRSSVICWPETNLRRRGEADATTPGCQMAWPAAKPLAQAHWKL